MTESWKAIIKKHVVNRFGTCAYLYRNGALVTWAEEYKGKTLYFSAWKAQDISFNDDTLHRIVLHNASVLVFGIPSGVRGYPENSSDNTKMAGLTVRTIELVWSNGAVVRDDEIVGMMTADFHGQGSGNWTDGYGLYTSAELNYTPEHDDIIAA